MIKYEDEYLKYIQERGVGSNDQVASSPASYLSYLRSVSKLIEQDITPDNLRSELAISNICSALQGLRAPKTIRNYRSAMRQYVALVQEPKLLVLSNELATSKN
jgi:hypothetical protein